MSTILIVDDVEQNLYMLRSLLEGHGYEVCTANHGAEALELARQSPPHLIITDILMPVMDGFALCRAWKADAQLSKIPFVFYTATYTDPKDEAFAMSLGADRFCVKPQDPAAFVAILKDVVSQHRAGQLKRHTVSASQETDYLRAYNETLIHKLEKKVLDLQEANLHLEEEAAQRRQAEQTLLAQQAELKTLASELVLTEERLKRFVATQLHDEICQALAVAQLKAAGLSEAASDSATRRELSELRETIGSALQRSRSLTSTLSYPVLNVLGLSQAIDRWVKDEIRDKHGMATTFVHDGQIKNLDEDVQAVLFRGTRELLTNAIKHAQASKIRISLAQVGNDVSIQVEDDGVGIAEPPALNAPRSGGGFGILSVREALERLGGSIAIDSAPGKGTRATMTVPARIGPNSGDHAIPI